MSKIPTAEEFFKSSIPKYESVSELMTDGDIFYHAKEFVPYAEALELKELEFDEPCMASRDMNNDKGLIQIPTYSQAFRFFREKYKLKADIIHAKSNGGYTYTIWKWNFDNSIGNWERIGVVNSWLTYEETETACLTKLIELAKETK